MSRRRVVVLIVLVFLAGCGLRGPQPREVWQELIYQGRRFGYEHTVVARLPDGNFRYATDTRVLVSFVGARQEMTRRVECVVTPTHRPVSVKVEGKQLSGEVSAAGRVEGDELVVTFTRAGHELTRRLDISGGAIFGDSVGEWLADLPPGTETADLKLIDSESWTILPARATCIVRGRSGSVWDVDKGDMGTTVVRCDARGAVVETEDRLTGMFARRCAAEGARDIDYLRAEGRFVLMLPIGTELPAPHRLTELTIRLTWRDIPFQQFQLTDARQQLVGTSRSGRSYEAVVKIARPGAAGAAAPDPTSDEEFAACLAETMFVKPRDPAIRATAERIVAGKDTALEAAAALAEWVFKNVKPALIAETLTGPEVLRCRQGKCADYTTLYASLARAVGIPTRIALGVRMSGGHWGGHLWNEVYVGRWIPVDTTVNEVYVGRWIPVDATVNEVGESFSLLKFVHSDRVLGTLKVRFGLTDSLDIAIEGFQARPAALAGKHTTGVAGRVYTNVDYRCRLTAPADGWAIEPRAAGAAATVRFKIPEAEKVNLYFVAFPLPAGAEPKMLIDARLQYFKLTFKDLEVLENAPCRVGGAAGHTSRCRSASGKDGKTKTLRTEVIWREGDFGYLLNLFAEESLHDKHVADFRKLLASFEPLQP